jgi:hypothetical protein
MILTSNLTLTNPKYFSPSGRRSAVYCESPPDPLPPEEEDMDTMSFIDFIILVGLFPMFLYLIIIIMGNLESGNTTSFRPPTKYTSGNFNPQDYMREGISKTDVLHIRHAFESLRDEETADYIRVARLKELPIFTNQDITQVQ